MVHTTDFLVCSVQRVTLRSCLKTQGDKIKTSDGLGHAKTCLMLYVNNKGAVQPAHPRSLISTFVVLCLDSIVCILAIAKVTRF